VIRLFLRWWGDRRYSEIRTVDTTPALRCGFCGAYVCNLADSRFPNRTFACVRGERRFLQLGIRIGQGQHMAFLATR
jgi:hypothetical protein